MSQIRIIALCLIIIGILAFSYEGYITYTTREKVIDAGPIQVTADKTHKVSLPPVLGALAFVGGMTLLIVSIKRV
jgi:hypothetical protein